MNVNIEKILPVTEVRDSLNKIIDEVESSDELYVVTKNGKPSAIIVGVHHLEKLTGIKHDQLMPESDFPTGVSGASVVQSSTNTDDTAAASTTPSAIPADQLDTITPATPPVSSQEPISSPEPANPLPTPPAETPERPVSDSAVEDLFSDEASAPSAPDQTSESAPLNQPVVETPAPVADNGVASSQPATPIATDSGAPVSISPLQTPAVLPETPIDTPAINPSPSSGSQINPTGTMPSQIPPANQNQPQI